MNKIGKMLVVFGLASLILNCLGCGVVGTLIFSGLLCGFLLIREKWVV